jgi:hypothetical protein
MARRTKYELDELSEFEEYLWFEPYSQYVLHLDGTECEGTKLETLEGERTSASRRCC